MTTTYRYLFADLLTNNILGELPLTGVSFNQQLNQAGTLTGRLLLSGLSGFQFNVDASTIPGRCALYVDRDDQIVWGGIILGREYNSNSQSLNLTAREFESYFERRRITSDVVFTNTDQLTIAQSLFNTAQAAPFGDIGVIVGTNTSGILVSRTYYGYEFKQVYAAVQDLSRQLDGFDESPFLCNTLSEAWWNSGGSCSPLNTFINISNNIFFASSLRFLYALGEIPDGPGALSA